MKLNLFKLFLIITLATSVSGLKARSLHNQPDSAYLFSYSSDKNGGRNGLHFAWSIDQTNWKPIGPEMRFLFCDYGRWGKEKRLVAPCLIQDKNSIWHCIWSLNEYDGVFAHASSNDLTYWNPQTYPTVISGNNCLEPEVSYDSTSGKYQVSWLSNAIGSTQAFSVTTTDFINYSQPSGMPVDKRLNLRKKIVISGREEKGTIHKVSWKVIDHLLTTHQLTTYRDQLFSENSGDDHKRFAGLQPVQVSINVDQSGGKTISDLLIGVFFEDINYAADGGLYAELIQNRDFEYNLADKEGRDKTWNSKKSWQLMGEGTTFLIDSVAPVHSNNPHYAVLEISRRGAALSNEGFDGIPLVASDKYFFSILARNPDKQNKVLAIRLVDKNGNSIGKTILNINSSGWKKYETTLTADQSVGDARLEIEPETNGSICLDMISLFPVKTFKGRRNGLRADLAQAIADIHPRFVRFPGGCVAHGDGLENMYRWKNTVGPLESRKPQKNLWGYHQTAGLGYLEYFQFCEDIEAEPLPVVPAGVPCQNSATGGAGQQGGIPLCNMDDYVQEVLDLIEWANGSAKSKWGKMRAEAGHPEPFNLKYIGVGNEDLINDIFEERFTLIYKAVKEKHPEITVIGTVGPSSEGTDYEEGWKIATRLGVPMVDEHYYRSPGWFIHNQNFYDSYDRSKPHVYLGEYAAHLPGRTNNLETALAEALYLTALEHNGDVVKMASYAPLLAKQGHTQWNPDLIYFNNTEVKPTVGYFVQQLFGQNSGDRYLSSQLKVGDKTEAVQKRIATSVVRETASGDVIVKLVNILPVEVDSKINLNDSEIQKNRAIQTVLSGSPDDKNAGPKTSEISVSGDFSYRMPPYSFTVIRILNAQR